MGFVAADLTLPASLSIDGEGGARGIGGSMSQLDDDGVLCEGSEYVWHLWLSG